MASVYTNDLRLEEIGSGEQSGTWGDTTNTNLELIAEAFSFGTEAITTNADTHTTTIADGATDPGRSIFLKYTGTLDSTCTITLGPNTISKLWIIENGTSGSQSIIIKQGSGATVTILNGQTKAVYSDGAGSGGAIVDAFQDVAIPDLFVDDDLSLQSDGAIINFGANAEIQLTHVHDVGLLLTETGGGAPTIQLRDSAISISSSADATLDIAADGDINLTAGVDINIPANVGLTFGDDAEKIEGDGTDLTISGNNIKLTAADSIHTPTSGTSNVKLGVNAGNSIASGGNYNTVVGDEAGTAITTGDENVFVGYVAGDAISTAGGNTALGAYALTSDTLGSLSVAIGNNALNSQNFTTATDA